MFRILLILATMMPANAQAQPVSWGMAQCSALMEVMAGYVNRQPEKSHLEEAASLMQAAALTQSKAEGRNPAELKAVQSDKRAEWVAMGYTMAFKTEFRDWVQYCRSLARSYDIKLHKSMLR